MVAQWVNIALSMGLLGVELWALGDAIFRPSAAYDAVGKLPKLFWVLILVIVCGVHLAQALSSGLQGGYLGILGIAGIVAALVYLFGMKPELVRYGGRGRGRKRSSSDGPYGPW